jgi:hypothetical protein
MATRKNIATAITATSNVQVLILQINALNQQKLLRNVSTVKETTLLTTKAAQPTRPYITTSTPNPE